MLRARLILLWLAPLAVALTLSVTPAFADTPPPAADPAPAPADPVPAAPAPADPAPAPVAPPPAWTTPAPPAPDAGSIAPVADPAPPPLPPVAPAQPLPADRIFEGGGVFVASATDFSVTRSGELVLAHFGWVAVKIHDGAVA